MAGTLDVLFAGLTNVQTGYVDAATSTSTGEDVRYIDITISAVADVDRAIVSFEGGAGGDAQVAFVKSGGSASYLVSSRFTSTTNIRIATTNVAARIAGRWTVGE